MIKARMRTGASWNDAVILNLSSRGLLVRADPSPSRGSYLEIRRGAHVIVARVVWAGSDRFGVRTQDPVPADSLVRDPDSAAIAAKPGSADAQERRATPRSIEVRHEASRHKGKSAEFAVVVLAGGIAAMFIGSAVVGTVAEPLMDVQAALAAR